MSKTGIGKSFATLFTSYPFFGIVRENVSQAFVCGFCASLAGLITENFSVTVSLIVIATAYLAVTTALFFNPALHGMDRFPDSTVVDNLPI